MGHLFLSLDVLKFGESGGVSFRTSLSLNLIGHKFFYGETMNFRVLGLSLFLVVVAGGLLTHFRQQSITLTEKVKQDGPSPIPEVVKQGPLPKAVIVGSLIHNFGTMEIGSKGEHVFTIRNEGEAPLELVARKEDHSCQCTLGTLSKNGLQPGEETTIKLTWEIKVPNTQFQHYAKVRTNDPKNDSLTFRVQGLIGRRFVVVPGAEVSVGMLQEGKPNVKKLTVHSEVMDAFAITKLEPSAPNLIKVMSRPLTAEELEQINKPDPAAAAVEAEQRRQMAANSGPGPGPGKSEKRGDQDHKGHDHAAEATAEEDSLAGKTPSAKCGFEIEISFLPGFPIGNFRESLLVETDIADSPETRIILNGYRSGPIQILPTAGTSWSAEESMLKLGRFPASEGKKVRLMLFVKKEAQGFKIEDAKIDPPDLKYELVKDMKFQAVGREKFDLILEVPAGSAPVSLGAQNRGRITLNTNHPDAKEIKIEVEMASFKD